MGKVHRLGPEQGAHGFVSRDVKSVLAIDPGDTVVFQTLDAGWGAIEQPPNFSEPEDFSPRDLNQDVAHALTGPVEIRGARPGMVLEIHLRRIEPGHWGWSGGVKLPAQLDARLGIAGGATGPPAVIQVPRGEAATYWELQPERGIGISRSGHQLRLSPFMGIMGMPLDKPGIQSTFPPTPCGGNMDCRELVAGSILFLPIALPGGLFFTGDGHAVQGDGEVAGPALNCPMEVEMEFLLRTDLALTLPRAHGRRMAHVRLARKPRRGGSNRRRGNGQTHDRRTQVVGKGGAVPGEPGRASAGNANGEWRPGRACGASARSIELARASA